MKSIFIILLSIFSTIVFSHKGEKHKKERTTKEVSVEEIKAINSEYVKKIKPTFKRKCFDCHGTVNKLPWYSKIPGPKQIINHDIEEAKKHMDMSEDFPFKGHGTQKEDLESLRNTVDKNTMPPLRYKIMHWKSSLTKKEKKLIENWVEESLLLLSK